MKFESLQTKKAEGFTQKDFALRNASWTLANLTMERGILNGTHDGFTSNIREFCPPYKSIVSFDSPKESAKEIKQVSKLFGADVVGLTAIDWRWHYTHHFDAVNFKEVPETIPKHLTGCIVIGTEMNYDLVETYPSALGGASVGLGYSKETFTIQTIAQYIRYLGYEAVASVNDTALTIPYAIQAGLAEYGRNGLAINKKYGPRLRFAKIFTNLPFDFDKPNPFGVEAFCKICNKCATACPAKAISFGEPNSETYNVSNIKGINKWSVDGEKCFKSWINQGTECGICIRVCPYNKPISNTKEKIFFNIFLRLSAGRFRHLALLFDSLLKYGQRLKPNVWWRNRK